MPITRVEGQVNTGTATATTSITATLPSATTPGNHVILRIAASGTYTSPTGLGFTKDSAAANPGIHRKLVTGAETSWVVNAGAAREWTWHVEEVEGIDPDAPIDAVPGTAGTGGSTGNPPTSSTYDGMAYGLVMSSITSTTPPTISGTTNGFTETANIPQAGAVTSVTMQVLERPIQSVGVWSSSATVSGGTTVGLVVVYTATGAKRVPNIAHFWGNRVGAAAAGLSTGVTGSRYFETVTGTPAMTGSGLQLTGVASAQNVAASALSVSSQTAKASVSRVRFRLDSLSGDLELYQHKSGTTADTPVLWYRSGSQKLALKVGAGSDALSNATVTTGVWYSVDMRLIGTTTAFVADWQVDYGAGPVTQTQATSTSAAAVTSWTPQLGWVAASTGTVTYDYAAFSIWAGHYPLGELVPVLLKADPVGTLTISGSAANFQTFTGNGSTLTAWNAATALANIDDGPPPTIGASADGLCQVTTAGLDYVEIPMESYAAAGNASIRALRMCACGWAASATAASIGFRGWDGSDETHLFTSADPAFDNSTTDPAWVCKMYRPTGGWTQAKLNALAFRVGFSDDATPDIGIHAIYAEVAIQAGTTGQLFGDLASATSDPVTAGVLGVSVAPTGGYDATLHYEESGSPTDVATPGGATTTEVIDAPDAPSVEYVALYPPAEDISDA